MSTSICLANLKIHPKTFEASVGVTLSVEGKISILSESKVVWLVMMRGRVAIQIRLDSHVRDLRFVTAICDFL